MSATLNAGSVRSDDKLYAASRTLKSYLRSILMRKRDQTDPQVRLWSKAETLDLSIKSPLYPRKRTNSGHLDMSALCQKRTFALQQISYSITSSARASTLSGTLRPSALAVLRLMTSSYLVGACTGRSAGFSPLRMRST